MDDHTGTHIDSPSQFYSYPGKAACRTQLSSVAFTVEQLRLEDMIGEAVVVDCPVLS